MEAGARLADLRLPQALLPKIGGMATMPSRAESLRQALPNILPQVDHLYIYLDKYGEVPDDLAQLPNVTCVLPEAGHSLSSSGKFKALSLFAQPCLFFGFDDDILYGANYVRHLAVALQRHRYRVLAGLHAANYDAEMTSYTRSRRLLHFAHALEFDVLVDELGTGTMAFHSSVIDIEPERWTHPNMSDLHIMIDAVRQEVPRVSVRRERRLARPIEQRQDDSLFSESLKDDSTQTRMLREAMRHYPARWSMTS